MKNKLGAIAEFTLRRKDGTVYKTGLLHNRVGQSFLSHTGRRESSVASSFLMPDKYAVPVAGTFSKTGYVITRQTGSFDLSSLNAYDIIEFSDGSCSTIDSKTVTTVTTYDNVDKPEQGIIIRQDSKDSRSGEVQVLNSMSVTTSYTSGKYSRIGTPLTTPITSPGTINRVTKGGGVGYLHFDLPSPIVVSPGDYFSIEYFEFSITDESYGPQALAVCPIPQLTTSCIMQKLLRPADSIYGYCDRIILLSEANKITIPNKLGLSDSYVSVSGLTKIETISASDFYSSPGKTNNFTMSKGGYGIVAVGGLVKQILLSNSSVASWVLEFDTPQNLDVGKVITLVAFEQFIP